MESTESTVNGAVMDVDVIIVGAGMPLIHVPALVAINFLTLTCSSDRLTKLRPFRHPQVRQASSLLKA